MFDVGFSELALIALVALIVLGPEKLPGVARTVGALVRRARSSWQNVKGEIERELAADELRKNLEEARRAADIGPAVRAAAAGIEKSVKTEGPASHGGA
jgi:sec-independent protein translocase protein TatB